MRRDRRTEIQKGGRLVKPAKKRQYGAFLTAFSNLLFVALVVFILVKGINKARKRHEAEQPAAAPAGPSQVQLLSEVRGILKRQS